MKPSTLLLSSAALSLALLTPAFAQNNQRDMQNNNSQMSNRSDRNWNSRPMRGEHEAMRMVPARATLTRTLDSDKTAPGYQFRATLSHDVRLDNGMKLHRGDVLLGRVANDDMNVQGRSRLALRFDQAMLHDGQTIPIKATIVGLYTPGNFISEGNYDEQVPNNWNDGTLQVDQIGVTHGVDLHSRIASRNSGVFIATHRDDVRLPSGSELALAIAPSPAMASNSGY